MSDKLKVYVAGWYSRREELLALSRSLEQNGFDVCSRWLSRSQPEVTDYDDCKRFAEEDRDDIDECDIFVLVSNNPGQLGGGGRHWELGYVYAQEQTYGEVSIFTVGPREHVFYCMDGVTNYEAWDEFLCDITIEFGD